MLMLCVTTVSYSVLVNGDEVGPIVPGRGLPQGNPLSPYLFILCAEGLSSHILAAKRRGEIHGCQVNRGATSVSHLFFADDSFLFFKASTVECSTIKHILAEYEAISGQSIHFKKSGIFFSPNVDVSIQNASTGALGVSSSLDTGRYLGLPSLIGKTKKAIFGFLKDRLWKKIEGWKKRFLSRAGKKILIKVVVQSIPTYCMSIFLLPITLCDELQKMLNSFCWGTKKDGKRSIHRKTWEKLCCRKEDGGVGFRHLQSFNLALLGKHGWNLLSQPYSLVARLLKAKYYTHDVFPEAKLGHNPTFIWRSV